MIGRIGLADADNAIITATGLAPDTSLAVDECGITRGDTSASRVKECVFLPAVGQLSRSYVSQVATLRMLQLLFDPRRRAGQKVAEQLRDRQVIFFLALTR